jgi:hypothetical protein
MSTEKWRGRKTGLERKWEKGDKKLLNSDIKM